MTKSNKLFLIFILAFALIVGISFATPQTTTALASINYAGEITISNGENGYLYGNGETFNEAETLQEAFDAIDGAISQNGIMKIRFSNLTASDSIVLNYSHGVVIGGNARFNGSVNDTFITVSGGSLDFLGAELTSPLSCIVKVSEGATLTMTSGTLAVDGAVTGLMQSTILNGGRVIINRGQIRYDSTTPNNAGQAIAQIGANSYLEITESTAGSVLCSGKTVLRLSGGNAVINGGTFNATASDSTENGSAIKVSNNAVVTVNGGTFGSVDPQKTVVLAGNGTSILNFNGGTIDGKITIASGAPSSTTSFISNNKTVVSSLYGNVTIYSDTENITPESARLGLVPIEGHYLVGWNTSSEVTPYLTDFADGTTIIAKTSNLYKITLKAGDTTKELDIAYGSLLNPLEYDFQIPAGYEIVGWNDGTTTLQAPLTIRGTATYTAILELASPIPQELQNVIKSYDSVGETRTAKVSEAVDVTYSYVWQKKNIVNDWIDYYNGKEIVFTFVADSGDYRLKVTATSGAQSRSAYSNDFRVEISKGNYLNVAHAPFSGVYDSTKTLSSYTLESGFNWLNSALIPTVPQKEYEAVYCLDAENYNELRLNIVIDLEKAPAQEASYPTRANNYKYSAEKTLADYPFNDNKWRWADENIVPSVGSVAYVAYYNIDRDNYYDYETKVTLVIDKGDYENIQNLQIDIKYVSELTVLYVIQNHKSKLGAYAFDSSVVRATPLNELKTYTFPAYYNTDSANYNDYEDCFIEITVTKGDISATYNYNNTIKIGGYVEGRTLKDVPLKENWKWEDTSIVPPAGTNKYYVIYNPNPEFYNDYRLEVKVIVDKGTFGGATHPDLSGVYSPTKTLADYTLSAGWNWVNPSEIPVVNKSEYDAVLNVGTNYNLYYTTITLNLSKATIDMSSITFVDKRVTYNGEAHNIVYEGVLPQGVALEGYLHTSPLIDAGTYNCEVYFVQTDLVNYNVIDDTLEATLIIDKATHDMSGVSLQNKEVTYNGQPHSLEIVGTLPSGVSVIYYNNGKIDAGRYVIEVQFIQSDTKNYNAIAPRQGVLLIEKATPTIIANELYNFAYTGSVKMPSVSVNNGEQIVKCEYVSDLKSLGEHTIKYYVNESPNYLYAEKSVKVVINKTEITCGSIYGEELASLIGKVTNTEEGIFADANLTMNIIEVTEREILVNILLGGKATEGRYTVNILLPDNVTGTPQVYVNIGGEYQLLSTTIGGNYLIFQTPTLGEFKLVTDGAWIIVEKGLAWWAWLLISLAIAVVIGGSVVLVIILYKKDKLPIDKIKNLFSKKVNIGNNGSQNIDTITDENPSEDESNEE